ncbi:MAG: [FeFe] hydrogenase H-cluster radical SAM maturase HydE [Bacteroidales bacterium]
MNPLAYILEQKEFSREDIITLLSLSNKESHDALIKYAYSVKEKTVGRVAYVRGIIEFSNVCKKNCFYCGIRKGNKAISRYVLTDEEVMNTVDFALSKNFNGLVLQSGETTGPAFTERITRLIRQIKKRAGEDFRITLSLGEQSFETYQQWFYAGAQRYLLRIETSSEKLYRQIHPNDSLHRFDKRLECLINLKSIGYQVGTGVMIGLPFQSIADLADDLLFFKNMDIDMVGMGPYIEHRNTPLYKYRNELMPLQERFYLSLRMISVLRIMMPYINIASTTALQAIHPMGRELGLRAGANILMPNLTPGKYRSSYLLYENKPCINDEAQECLDCLINRVRMIDEEIDFDHYGDSEHFKRRSSGKTY